MTATPHPAPATARAASLFRPLAPWVAAGMTALPLVVLSHELGHYLLYRAFGFPGAVLHHASATHALADQFWDAARAGAVETAGARAVHVLPPWQVGAATAGGLVVTYASLAAAWVVLARAARHRPLAGRWAPLAAAVALVAPLRFASGFPAARAWVGGRDLRPGTDEGSVSLLAGVHPGPLSAFGLTLLAISWFLVGRYVARARPGLARIAALLVALVTGGLLYATVVGPRLLG